MSPRCDICGAIPLEIDTDGGVFCTDHGTTYPRDAGREMMLRAEVERSQRARRPTAPTREPSRQSLYGKILTALGSGERVSTARLAELTRGRNTERDRGAVRSAISDLCRRGYTINWAMATGGRSDGYLLVAVALTVPAKGEQLLRLLRQGSRSTRALVMALYGEDTAENRAALRSLVYLCRQAGHEIGSGGRQSGRAEGYWLLEARIGATA